MDEVKDVIKAESGTFDYFEIWLDYLESPKPKKIAKLAEKYPERLLLLFRRKGLEEIKLSLEDRKELIDELAELPVYFDFDISAQTAELDYFCSKERKAKLITSYHNYDLTPPDEALDLLLEKMESLSPEIVKFAAFCSSPDDAFRLLSFLIRIKKDQHRKPIVLGMGEHGLVTRCFGGYYGNTMTFVTGPEATGATAPGQLSIDQLQKFESILSS